MDIKLDETDIRILNLLQDNARITIKAMAEKLNLSTTPVFERVKKLEKGGVIKNYVALLNERKLGLKQTVFISISLKEHGRSHLEKFVEEVHSFPEVMECYRITGNFDYLIKVLVQDIEAYEQFIMTKLSLLASLGDVQSHIALSEAKKKNKVNLKFLIR